MALTTRISQRSDAIIQELAAKTGKSKVVIIEEALESYRFRERMRLFNESYERLRAEKQKWAKPQSTSIPLNSGRNLNLDLDHDLNLAP